jgi:hypothetical protein
VIPTSFQESIEATIDALRTEGVFERAFDSLDDIANAPAPGGREHTSSGDTA